MGASGVPGSRGMAVSIVILFLNSSVRTQQQTYIAGSVYTRSNVTSGAPAEADPFFQQVIERFSQLSSNMSMVFPSQHAFLGVIALMITS